MYISKNKLQQSSDNVFPYKYFFAILKSVFFSMYAKLCLSVLAVHKFTTVITLVSYL